jgi:hypothetical protein
VKLAWKCRAELTSSHLANSRAVLMGYVWPAQAFDDVALSMVIA